MEKIDSSVYVRTEMSQINRYCNIDKATHYNLEER